MYKMNSFVFVLILFLFSGSIAWAEVDVLELEGIKNVILLEEDLVAGGPPSENDIKKAKEIGIKAIIDLRRPEKIENEKTFVQSQGLEYFNIPVTPENLTRHQVDEVAKILSDPKNRPAIIHCGSGNRAGAVWALYSKYYKGMNSEEAYKEGIKKGMRSEGIRMVTKKLLNNKGLVKKSVESSSSHSHSEVFEDGLDQLRLDSGRKWKADDHTRLSFAKMAGYFLNLDLASQGEEELKKAGSELQLGINELVTGCTMNGDAHDQLHVFLMSGYVPAVAELSESGSMKEAEKVKHYLNKYSEYFE